LTNEGASDSGIAVWWLAKFHHLPGENFSSIILNQACSWGVYCGSHSDKGHRNKADVSEVEVFPPVRAVCLAFLSAFWFPWIAVVSFWCPQQCMTATCLRAHIAFSNFRISCSYFKTKWGTQTEFLSESKFVCFSYQDTSGHLGVQAG
jgi:hypothetical protein